MHRGRSGLLEGLLMAAGVVLLGVWACVAWIGPPLEEPANIGRTPDPSRAPWTYDPLKEAEERARGRLSWRLILYGPPAAGALLIAIGALSLAGRKC